MTIGELEERIGQHRQTDVLPYIHVDGAPDLAGQVAELDGPGAGGKQSPQVAEWDPATPTGPGDNALEVGPDVTVGQPSSGIEPLRQERRASGVGPESAFECCWQSDRIGETARGHRTEDEVRVLVNDRQQSDERRRVGRRDAGNGRFRKPVDRHGKVAGFVVLDVGKLRRQHVPPPHEPGLLLVKQSRRGTVWGTARHLALYGLSGDAEYLSSEDRRTPGLGIGRDQLMTPYALQPCRCHRYVLGRTHGAAGAVIVHRPLIRETSFTGELLALDERPEILVGLDRHRTSVAVRIADLRKPVALSEVGGGVRREDPPQEGGLNIARCLRRFDQTPVVSALRRSESRSQDGVANHVRN